MKKILMVAAIVALALSMVGCDDDTKEKAKELTFVNDSHYTVQVIPLTIEFQTFALLSGERRKFGGIENPDFRYEPDWQVEEGQESTDRYVVFVDLTPE